MRELFLTPPRPRVDPAIPQDKPVFRILDEHGFFGPNDHLYPQGSLVVLYDCPNENMEPMNDLAKESLSAYLDMLDDSAKKVAETNGRYFASRPRSKEEMMDNASEMARNKAAIMGAKIDTSKRIEDIGQKEVPETNANDAKRRARIETVS